MKRFGFPIVMLLVLSFLPAAPAGAQVYTRSEPESARTFAFVLGDKTFPVPAGLLEDWHRPVTFTQNNWIVRQPINPNDLLARYVGETEVPTPYHAVNYNYDPGQIFSFIKTTAASINISPVEPVLVVENNRATKFAPPQDGVQVDIYRTLRDTLAALENNSTSTHITVSTTSPKTSLAELNSLGIRELVAQGTSSFKGSPRNRTHNIQVGVRQMTGIIIAPGEEFSFNKFLGPVDGEHDFLPELVIKKSGTVPEFGGGLCQVSSTAFRAAMAGGLPITQRRNHAYAVQYYAPQGTDATIYPGIVDLKFINDTPGHILIWPYLKDKTTLIFDFYGTKDSRQVTLDKPVQWDRKADGSMKASWTRVVVKDGEASTSTFKSIYQPPALFHKTEEFAKPISTPTAVQ